MSFQELYYDIPPKPQPAALYNKIQFHFAVLEYSSFENAKVLEESYTTNAEFGKVGSGQSCTHDRMSNFLSALSMRICYYRQKHIWRVEEEGKDLIVFTEILEPHYYESIRFTELEEVFKQSSDFNKFWSAFWKCWIGCGPEGEIDYQPWIAAEQPNLLRASLAYPSLERLIKGEADENILNVSRAICWGR